MSFYSLEWQKRNDLQLIKFILFQWFYVVPLKSVTLLTNYPQSLFSFWRKNVSGVVWLMRIDSQTRMEREYNLARQKKPYYSKSIIKFWINKVIKRNRFLRPFLIRRYESSVWWGLAVFIIREPAIKLKILSNIGEIIKGRGFEIIDTRILSVEEKKRMSIEGRGGNWPGGLPDACIICFDTQPQRTDIRFQSSDSLAYKYPEVDNLRITEKLKMREEINDLFAKNNPANFIHVTDNSYQAWEYLQLCNPDYVQEVRNKIDYLYKVCPLCGPGNYLDRNSGTCSICIVSEK